MAKASKGSAENVQSAPGYEGHFEELGGYTVGFETFGETMDAAPLFAGLPGDRCQSPHWGVVLKGRLTFHYEGRDETIEAGEAYYAEPGHTPAMEAGTEVVEFSPTEDLGRTMEVVMRNAAALQGA